MKNIIWCIDLNNQQVDKQQCLKTLQAFTSCLEKVQITPLYVLSSKSTQVSRFSQASLLEKLIPWAQNQLEEYISELKSELNFQDPKVIFNSKHSLKQDVLKVLEYAEEINADTIFCSTHSKKLWNFGSFA